MAYYSRQLINQVCIAAVLGTHTANLDDALQIAPTVFPDWPQVEVHSENQDLARFEYVLSNMRISVGKLCNTSIYDDSENTAVENLVKRVLGNRAANRFSELRKIRSGWDFGKGEALNEGAIKNLSALLSRMDSGPANVKLFLSSEGSLEIRWKRQDEESISVLAKYDSFEVLLPEDDEERTFSDSDFHGVLGAVGIDHSIAA